MTWYPGKFVEEIFGERVIRTQAGETIIGLEWYGGLKKRALKDYIILGSYHVKEGEIIVEEGIVIGITPENKLVVGFATRLEYSDWYEVPEDKLRKLARMLIEVL